MLEGYAREFGLSIILADLGEWTPDVQLHSEYDPRLPQIRINRRVVEQLPSRDEQIEFITKAIGHELYHHFEHRGEVRRFQSRVMRERIADEFATQFLQAVQRVL